MQIIGIDINNYTYTKVTRKSLLSNWKTHTVPYRLTAVLMVESPVVAQHCHASYRQAGRL